MCSMLPCWVKGCVGATGPLFCVSVGNMVVRLRCRVSDRVCSVRGLAQSDLVGVFLVSSIVRFVSVRR